MEEELLCRCGALGEKGYCPYALEVHNALPSDAECNCCADCVLMCAMDV